MEQSELLQFLVSALERLRLRYTPEVHFYRDDSIERNLRIAKLFDGLKGESKTE